MDSKNLMIGDWVLYKDKPHKIWCLTDTYVYFSWGLIVNHENIAPIPLTAEILENNGWAQVRNKDDANGSMETWFMPGVGYAYHFTRGYEFEIISYGLNNHGNAKYRGTLEYIHQLQNALRLCELNDLANNFKIN